MSDSALQSYSQRYSIPFLWLSIMIFFVLSGALFQVIHANDYWWYVRIGQDIVQQRAIPVVDTMSYTQAGQPIVYHSWLSAVVFATVYDMAGMIPTLLLRGVLLVGFYVAIWLACREAGAAPPLATILVLVAAIAGINNWAMRPQLFAYPLFGLSVWLLWRWQNGKTFGLWLLPLLMLVWVNVHGSFVIGFLLVGAAFVGGAGDRKALLWPLVGMFLASLFNPRGLGAWAYVVSLLTDNSSQEFSMEWRPPSNATWVEHVFFAWVLVFGLFTAVSPRKLTLTHWLWFLGFGWIALSGIRYVIWFVSILATISAYLLAPLASPYLDKPPSNVRPGLNGLISLALLTLPILMLPGLRHAFWADAPPTLAENTPVAATEWLSAHAAELPGPLLADVTFASYHTFALPEYPVWIDTRFELYPPEQWEMYWDISTAVPNWSDLLDEEGINLLLLDPETQELLIQAIQYTENDWELCYQDDVALLFIRLDNQPLPNACQTFP